MGRRVTFDEFISYEWSLIDRQDKRVFIHAVGQITIGWAHIETLLDYANYFVISTFETKENSTSGFSQKEGGIL